MSIAKLPTKIPRLRSPIVLVHGLFGFAQLKLRGWIVANYFSGVSASLETSGNRVLLAQVSPTGAVVDRAAQLKSFLDKECPGEPVHLIAHSMGGLDSRFMISRLGMADRVLTLTSIGTPHRGTAFADWGVERLARLLKPMLAAMGVPYQAFFDLTTRNCHEFNERTPDAAGVRYFSVAGRHEGGWHSPEWRLSHSLVTRKEGPNDGIVSIESASYGENCDVWEGDHLSLINWRNPVAQFWGKCRERTPQYTALVQRLADEGY
jgi:triacylglycerol lipase